ncbi:MAG: MT-A70 family methyltransferase [Alphaproteobacteria bacterium]|nr:MT-A70 family methyltransferase [Alphaproteobacteria bacterium]
MVIREQTQDLVESVSDTVADYSLSNGLFPPLPRRKYSIIYADPPWDYKGQLQHNGPGGRDSGGAVRHYSTVKLTDLMQLPVESITGDDCLLFMWSSSPHLDQAIDLGKAWGFSWATIAFVWHTGKPNPGFYTMSECEICLVMKHGKIPRPRGARNIRQFLLEKRKGHSRKPDEVRRRIEEMFPEQDKIELFARQKARGWAAWGAQV